ncbi:MAG: sulfatase [Bacteroidia bacterium]|nr:sulfatase [Bacteroidia bacterium]
MKTSKPLNSLFKGWLQKISSISLLITPVMQVVGAQQVQKPNFILILTDDQGWTSSSQLMDDNISNSKSDFYETSNIERFAARGMRFTSGYAPCALSCPTRRSIQFGQTPARQGDALFKENYHPDYKMVPAIPQILKSISPDYRAAHYGKWDLRADIFPEDLGYDESDGNTGNSNGDMNSTKDTKWTDFFLNNDPKRIETITARALNFMSRQVKTGHPFFLQVSHYATHVDMQTTEETYNKYLQKKKGEIHSNPAWAGMLENLDSGIGRILDMIDQLGIADHTYLILMADNGGVEFIPPVKNKFDHPSVFSTHTRNYPLRGGKWTLYEGGIRVPFIVIGPGIKAGSQCNVPVTGWDLLPTFADLAGNKTPLPDNLDGTSISPLLENGNEGKFKRKTDELVFHYFGKSHSAIRVGDYKLIKFWDSKKIELYNLKDDIGELSDLSKKETQKAEELESKLMAYLKEVHAEILYPTIKQGVKTKDDGNRD